jgi:hypothetical protein
MQPFFGGSSSLSVQNHQCVCGLLLRAMINNSRLLERSEHTGMVDFTDILNLLLYVDDEQAPLIMPLP